MNNLNFISIETPRLLLKGIHSDVMKQIFDHLHKDEIKKILGHQSDEEYQKEEYKHQNGYTSYNRKFVMFLLSQVNDQKIIGRCGLHNWNDEHKRAELGYIMHRDEDRNKGFMSEAVGAVLEYGFQQLKLNRIEALASSENPASLKILKKHHFVQEGILRQHMLVDSRYHDSAVFAILRSEHKMKAK